MDFDQNMLFAKEVGQVDFRDEVLEWNGPVVVVFWAPWSGACDALRPVFLDLIVRCERSAKFVLANVDENPDLGMWYDIEYLPSILCFARGEVVVRIHGTASAASLLEKLEPILASAGLPEEGRSS